MIMDRTLYGTYIQAIQVREDLIRISFERRDFGECVYHYIMQKEYDFLKNILDAFANDGNIADSILRIAKEYKGYDGKADLQNED